MGPVLEAHPSGCELEPHEPRRAVALLRADLLREPAILVGRLVVLGPVEEEHDIGVLLDRSRLTQVRELRTLVVPELDRARELRERDDGHVELAREVLERSRDLTDLLLTALGLGRGHELEVVDDDQVEAAPIAKAIEETFQRIDSASHRAGLTGLPSGFYELDEMLCGFNPGELIVLASRPSMGKTALALNMIDHAALHPPEWLGRPPAILFFSLEMGQQSIVRRMLCSHARVDAHKLRTGRIPSDDYQRLAEAAGNLASTQVFIDDSPGLTVMALRSRSRRLRARHGLDLVVVDYLQLMSHPRAESRQQEISQISRALKDLSRELDVPVIALSQLSRAVELRDDKRPQLSDLRESGSIEQDADVVLLLFRSEYYEATEENRGQAEVVVAKQRNGPTGTVRLQFLAPTMRFENRAPSLDEPFQA